MATTVTTPTIKFEHTVALLLDAVEKATGNIASKLPDQAEALDNFTLTEDELFLFHEYLKKAHVEIGRVIRKFALGILSGITIDDTKVMYTIENKTGYNTDVLPEFDKMIFDSIVNFIIKEWFMQCGLKDGAVIYEGYYQKSLKMIPKYSMSLRSSSLS